MSDPIPHADTLPYADHICTGLYAVYIVAIIIWLIIVVYFRLYTVTGAFVLWLPIVVFAIGIANADELTVEVEKDMFKASYLSVGLLLALPLLAWMSKDYNGDKAQFTAVVVLAMVLTLLTLVDIWIPKKWLSVYKHGRSCLQTMAVALLIYALVTYFLARPPGPMP